MEAKTNDRERKSSDLHDWRLQTLKATGLFLPLHNLSGTSTPVIGMKQNTLRIR